MQNLPRIDLQLIGILDILKQVQIKIQTITASNNFFPPKLKTVVNLLLNLFTIHVCVSFSRNRFQWTQGADLFLNVKERKRPTVQGMVEI